MYYTSRHVFNLAMFDFSIDYDLGDIKDCLFLIAGFILEKGDLIRTNINNSLVKSENIFLIQNIKLYFKHHIYRADKEYICRAMESDLKNKVAIHVDQIRKVLIKLTERIPEAFDKYRKYESTFKQARDSIKLINGCIHDKVIRLGLLLNHSVFIRNLF